MHAKPTDLPHKASNDPAEATDGLQRLASLVANKFANEAKRLKDPSVFHASRDLFKSYTETLRQLGTLEHELALSALRRQIDISDQYAARSRAKIRSQAHILLPRRSDREMDQIATDALLAINESLKRADIDDEWKAGLEQMRQSLLEVESLARDMEVSDRKGNRVLFWNEADLHINVYTRLALQRSIAFVGRHAFIVLLPVLIAGMGYSWLIASGQSLLIQVLNLGLWGVIGIGFAATMFKEYVVSRRLKALRLRVERRLLAPVV
jgi:hypothetical protein